MSGIDYVTSMLLTYCKCSYSILNQEEYTYLASIYNSAEAYTPQYIFGQPTAIFIACGEQKRVIFWVNRIDFEDSQVQDVLLTLNWL